LSSSPARVVVGSMSDFTCNCRPCWNLTISQVLPARSDIGEGEVSVDNEVGRIVDGEDSNVVNSDTIAVTE
jgi:hypothetical protein